MYELVKFNDVPTAAKWGVRCGLPLERLPSSVQLYLRDHKERYGSNLLKMVADTPGKYLSLVNLENSSNLLFLLLIIFVVCLRVFVGCWL